MTVAFDKVQEFAQWTTENPRSIEFAPVGVLRGIYCGITQVSDANDRIVSVTCEGVTMNRVDRAFVATAGSAWLYFLGVAIPAGTVTVEITTDAAALTRWAAVGGVTAAGDTVIGASAKLQAAQADPQITLDTGANESLRVSIIHSFQGTLAALAEIAGMAASVAAAEHDYGSQTAKLGRQSAAVAGSATVGYTTASTTELMVAAAIEEVFVPGGDERDRMGGTGAIRHHPNQSR